MTEDKARYLVAHNQENKPVAMVHFRFDMDYEEAVLYWYALGISAVVVYSFYDIVLEMFYGTLLPAKE